MARQDTTDFLEEFFCVIGKTGYMILNHFFFFSISPCDTDRRDVILIGSDDVKIGVTDHESFFSVPWKAECDDIFF